MSRNSNCGPGWALRPSSMHVFDKLPRGMRVALANADHNWSGEQLYQQYRKRNPKVRTTALAVAFLANEDAKKHVSDTADFYFGVMPGQREVTDGRDHLRAHQ